MEPTWEPTGELTGKLSEFGWTEYFEKSFNQLGDKTLKPARIIRQDRGVYRVLTTTGESEAYLSGKLSKQLDSHPCVGDWVALRQDQLEHKPRIEFLLERQTVVSRKVAGAETRQQAMAANIDTLMIVAGLDGEFNLRRIERYLVLCYDSGALPVVVLNKVDACDKDKLEEFLDQTRSSALGVDVYPVSAKDGLGIDALHSYLSLGSTVALLGSSGVGKSSLINCLLGQDRLKVGQVRESDKKGRHVTTSRQLLLTPWGGAIIDTPGLREIQLWGGSDGLRQIFRDIEELAESCKFRDCGHHSEPGCAVRQAIEDGKLESKRLVNYHKMAREYARLEERSDERSRHLENQRAKSMSKMCKEGDWVRSFKRYDK